MSQADQGSSHPRKPSRVALDLWRTQRGGAEGVARRQALRFEGLLEHARSKSPFYRNWYRQLPASGVARQDLPPVNKPALMAAFDAWVTDPQVTRAGVEAFIADPARIGAPFLGQYFVCTTSGTTGQPAVFVHDADAIAVYLAFTYRLDLAWFSARDWLGLARRRFRWATVVGTGAHFAGAGWIEFQRHRSAWRRRAFRVFSVQQPLAELVAALNAFDPGILTGYPSALALLAGEQRAGRLRVRPVIAETGGESLGRDERERISSALGAPVHEVYGASEFDPLAFDCDQGWLHVNSDWAILEPVDADLRQTPPGQPSHTVLLTNLANRVQPILRYDLGDSVTARPDPCPCGSPLQAIRVEGRRDDVLRLSAADGRAVTVLPLAIGTVAEETAGVHRVQLVQTAPASIRLRLEPKPGADVERLWRELRANLGAYLATLGLSNVELVRAAETPEQSARSGKFRQVIARRELGPPAG